MIVQNATPIERAQLLKTTSPLYVQARIRYGALEAVSDPLREVVQTKKHENFHPLIAAAHLAFSEHFPLRLTLDALWLPIAQSLARHVKLHDDQLGQKLIRSGADKVIRIERDDFVIGSATNDWPGCWDSFEEAIQERVHPEFTELMRAEFSTTGPTERAANQVVLMESVSSYFYYEVETLCGIPEIQIEGTPSDYELIVAKIDQVATLFPDLVFWSRHVRRFIWAIRNALAGLGAQDLCENIYKWGQESGGDRLSGGLLSLFAYTKSGSRGWERNPALREKQMGKLRYNQIPDWISAVEFNWKYLGMDHPYEFLSGLGAIGQDVEALAVYPVAMWGVRPKGARE